MRINSLGLTSFKNYPGECFCFHPEVNIVSGDNAQGKTNLLESIYLLSTLRALRCTRESELILFGRDAAEVTAKTCDNRRENSLSVRFFRGEKKQIVKNGVTIRKHSDFCGALKTVFFSPDDMQLVKEGSAARRKLADVAMSQLRPRYNALLSEYNRTLLQKGKALKAGGEKPSMLGLLPAYDERIAYCGGELVAFRHAYFKMLNSFAAPVHGALSGGREELQLRYRSVSNITDTSQSAKEHTAKIAEHLEAHRGAEIASRSCLSGPHRDDLEIYINEKPAKTFASQGQIRTAVLSLKLAEREIFRKETGAPPVLLLDDVLSELDPARQDFVLNRIKGGQVFISCCAVDARVELLNGKKFVIANGRKAMETEL